MTKVLCSCPDPEHPAKGCRRKRGRYRKVCGFCASAHSVHMTRQVSWREHLTDWDHFLWNPRPRKPDFDFVIPQLAVGGFVKDAEEAAVITDAGVTHVVNTAWELRSSERFWKGPEYLFNGVADNGAWKEADWFARTVDFALPAIERGGVVYVHCLEGLNRGPSSAYAVLRALGHSATEAEGLIRTARPRVHLLYQQDAERALRAVA